MGCCNYKSEVKIPPMKGSAESFERIKQHLAICVDDYIADFEKLVLEKIIPAKPRAMHEFDKIFKSSFHKIFKSFQQITSAYPTDPQIQGEIKKYEIFLISKCKSKEIFFRFLNNYYSYEFIYQLLKHIIEQMVSSNQGPEESISAYTRLARGSYILEGLEDLHEILNINVLERMSYLDNKINVIKKELQEDRDKLMEAYNSNALPNLSESVHSTSISFLHIPEAENLESSLDSEMDAEVLELDKKDLGSLLHPDYKIITNNYIT